MAIKFDMGADVLTKLTKDTSTSNDELVSLVRELADSDNDLQGVINGSGAIAYSNFKTRVDQCANDLSAALNMLNIGQNEMDRTMRQGDDDLTANAETAQGNARFEAANFRGSR